MTVQCMCEQPGTPCPKHPETQPVVAPELVSYKAPLAERECGHGRRTLYNLAQGYCRHADGDRSECDDLTGGRRARAGEFPMTAAIGPERFEGGIPLILCRHGVDTLTCRQDHPDVADLAGVPTAADRKAARVAVLIEGHAAGLHVVPAADCPSCPPADFRPGDRQRRAATRALDRLFQVMSGPDLDAGATQAVAQERFVEAVGDYVLSRLHHNGDYGVAPEDERRASFRALGGPPPDLPRCEGDEDHPPHPVGWVASCSRCAHRATGDAHKPDYGVAAANPYEGRSLEDLGEIMQSEDYRNPGAHRPDCDVDPCAGGRCSDPEAHAEGAHDV